MIDNTKFGVAARDDYDKFDQLPYPVRTALANADYDWYSKPFLDFFNETCNIVMVITAIRQCDFDKHRVVARRERRSVFCRRGFAVR